MGSAAFNLFCIIAICVVVIPTNQIRRIKHLRVFFVTSAFSIFAYVHLYLILAVFTPGIVTVLEGIITFLFFPLIVWMAYIADRRLLIYKYLSKGYRINEHGMMVQMESMNAASSKEHRSDSVILDNGTALLANDFKDPDRIRNDYVCILQHLRQQYPHYDRDTLEMMAQEQILDSGPKSRAFYRIQVKKKQYRMNPSLHHSHAIVEFLILFLFKATRKILGNGNVIRRIAERTTNEVKADLTHVNAVTDDDDVYPPRICFDPNHYTVMESTISYYYCNYFLTPQAHPSLSHYPRSPLPFYP